MTPRSVSQQECKIQHGCGIFVMVIWVSKAWKHYMTKTWWKDCRRLIVPQKCVKIVLLVNNIVILSCKEKHGELSKSYIWFIQTFVDQSIQHRMETKGTSLSSLMIIVEKHRFISCKINLKLLLFLKALRFMLKKNLASIFRFFVQIMVVNLTHIILQVFVNYMEYACNLLLHTHRNKMTWQKERIRRLWTWCETCW